MLFEDGFIAGKNDFAEWLNINSNNRCNWIKSRVVNLPRPDVVCLVGLSTDAHGFMRIDFY